MRTRLSPAPTGYLHVGNARSALFNWLLARREGGELLLRVEDTNAELYRPEFLDSILNTLDWLGITFDGEPVFQSKRGERYAEATEQLLDAGHAYLCDCTPEDVKARASAGAKPGYDGYCRDRGLPRSAKTAVRFRVPDDGATVFDDVIRGQVSVEHSSLEDFVIQRSNGSATFYLPNGVDDHDMGITHVVRGEDLINVTPRVLLIRDALGITERPVFAHLPMLVNEQRKKLSKRREDVAVEEYRERGVLPEAMRNYLAVLGWGPPDGVEIRPVEEIVELFRLEDVVKSSAFFDVKKLEHFNGEYIRRLTTEEFTARARPWLGDQADTPEWRIMAAPVQERVVFLSQAPEMVDFLFAEPRYDEKSWTKAMSGPAAALLDSAIEDYSGCDWDGTTLHRATEAIAERHGLKLNKAQAPIRVAVTGRSVGPPLFESLEALGRERTIDRLRRARERLADP